MYPEDYSIKIKCTDDIRNKKNTNKELKEVHMKIPKDLFLKSRALIPNRTEDYINYLKRKLSPDHLEIIKIEIDKYKTKINELNREYKYESEFRSQINLKTKKDSEKLNFVLEIVNRIIDNEGHIGMDRLEEIAEMHNVSLAKLKISIPKNKIVNYHGYTKKWR